jgi:hypothetical protein
MVVKLSSGDFATFSVPVFAVGEPPRITHPNYLSANNTVAKTGSVAVSSTSTGPVRKSIIMGHPIAQGGSL